MASRDKRDMFDFDETRNALEETLDLDKNLEERKISVENANYMYREYQESSSLQNKNTKNKNQPLKSLAESFKKELTWRDPDFKYERKSYSDFKEKGHAGTKRVIETRKEMHQHKRNTDEYNSTEKDTLQSRYRDRFLPQYTQMSSYNEQKYSQRTSSRETRDTWRSSSSVVDDTWHSSSSVVDDTWRLSSGEGDDTLKPSFSENRETCRLNKLKDVNLLQDNKGRNTWASNFVERKTWEATSISDKSYVKNKELGYFHFICDTDTIRDDGATELDDVWLKINQLNDDMDGLFSKKPSMSSFLKTDKTEIRCYIDSSDVSHVSKIATIIRSRLDFYPFTF